MQDACDDVFPKELKQIVDKKLLFKFAVTKYNLTNCYEIYRVVMASDDLELINSFMSSEISNKVCDNISWVICLVVLILHKLILIERNN